MFLSGFRLQKKSVVWRPSWSATCGALRFQGVAAAINNKAGDQTADTENYYALVLEVCSWLIGPVTRLTTYIYHNLETGDSKCQALP